MNPRQAQVLRLIVDEYVRTAEPVSSKQLCERYRLPCSSATVRNDMAVLEELQLIEQPHTSAGRVPTEKGYRFYLQHKDDAPKRQQIRVQITVKRIPRVPSAEERLQQVGHALAEASGEAVMLATTRPWSTTVGLANLLRKPEFQSGEAILNLAESLERFDAAHRDLLKSASGEITVLLGQDNPLGHNLSSIVVKSVLDKNTEGVMGIIGPLRMDYRKNMALLAQAKKALEQPQPLLPV